MFLIKNINNINNNEVSRIPVELYGIPVYIVFGREIISTFCPSHNSEGLQYRFFANKCFRNMDLNIIEKLAVIKAVDEVIRMDDMLDVGELDYLSQLAEALNFDAELLIQAREVEAVEAIAVIQVMPEAKKAFLMRSMTEAANADGVVDEAEIQFIYRVLSAAGISSGD
jgi:uncharacterized tellurite resistance protein B-like protein